MMNYKDVRPELEEMWFKNLEAIYWNASTPHLYEQIVRRREGNIAHLGPVVVRTGHHVGRSPDDRFIVSEPSSVDKIWWGKVNKGIEEKYFTNLFYRLLAYFQNKDIFIQDCYAGAHPAHRIPIRVITERAWHSLFARNMFIQMKTTEEADNHQPRFTVVNIPRFHAMPELDAITSEAFGVLPPVAKLTTEQAVYHFLSGYTAKVAGTEIGVREPQATFSACFGAPFMALPPVVYAEILMKKIKSHEKPYRPQPNLNI